MRQVCEIEDIVKQMYYIIVVMVRSRIKCQLSTEVIISSVCSSAIQITRQFYQASLWHGCYRYSTEQAGYFVRGKKEIT